MPFPMAVAQCIASRGARFDASAIAWARAITEALASTNLRWGKFRSFLPAPIPSVLPRTFETTQTTSSQVSTEV